MLQINRQDPLIKQWLSHIDECVGAVESIPPPTYHELMLFQREEIVSLLKRNILLADSGLPLMAYCMLFIRKRSLTYVF